MSESLIPFFLVSDVSELLRSLTKNKRCEQIAQVAHQNRATMNDLLSSLRGNEQSWANCSGRSPKICSFAHLLIFGQKRANHSENRWANSQPCFYLIGMLRFYIFGSGEIMLNCNFILMRKWLFSDTMYIKGTISREKFSNWDVGV